MASTIHPNRDPVRSKSRVLVSISSHQALVMAYGSWNLGLVPMHQLLPLGHTRCLRVLIHRFGIVLDVHYVTSQCSDAYLPRTVSHRHTRSSRKVDSGNTTDSSYGFQPGR